MSGVVDLGVARNVRFEVVDTLYFVGRVVVPGQDGTKYRFTLLDDGDGGIQGFIAKLWVLYGATPGSRQEAELKEAIVAQQAKENVR